MPVKKTSPRLSPGLTKKILERRRKVTPFTWHEEWLAMRMPWALLHEYLLVSILSDAENQQPAVAYISTLAMELKTVFALNLPSPNDLSKLQSLMGFLGYILVDKSTPSSVLPHTTREIFTRAPMALATCLLAVRQPGSPLFCLVGESIVKLGLAVELGLPEQRHAIQDEQLKPIVTELLAAANDSGLADRVSMKPPGTPLPPPPPAPHRPDWEVFRTSVADTVSGLRSLLSLEASEVQFSDSPTLAPAHGHRGHSGSIRVG